MGLSFTACGGSSELRPISDSTNGGDGGSAGTGSSGGGKARGGSGGSGGGSSGGSSGSSGGGGSDGNSVEPERGQSIFVLDGLSGLADATFFDHPWPSDARRDAEGRVLLEGYPNPLDGELIGRYLVTMEGRLDGFSPVAAGYLRFSVPLHPDSLPRTIPASAAANSSVQLIDIESSSPEFGERRPIAVSFRAEPGIYVPENTLSFAPAFGQPLRPETRYALVVTNDVRDTDGNPLEPAPTLSALLDEETPTGGDDYADALPTLAELGIYEEILHLAVFTTSDPTREAMSMRDATVESFESPSATGWSAQEQVSGVVDVYEGSYGPSPDYQAGTPPFASVSDGGDVRYDAEGLPIVQREFELRFALGVPDATQCPQPSAGYPVVLIAHGTGGNYRSAFGTDAEASLFAEQCLATLSIDQIFHGSRPGAGLSSELLYFNLENPIAARVNGPQSAVDFVQLARLVTAGDFSVPSNVSRTAQTIAFDPERVLFFGHSQGGLNGPIFLASDDQALGGVMSGAAATISIALLDKTAPLPFAALLAVLLGLEGDAARELDEFHPALSLAQTIADPSDGIHYARHALLEPRPGFEPKSLLMTEGVRADGSGDNYAPPRGIEALAAATGLPTRLPQIHPSPFADWRGLEPLEVPSQGLSGNLAGGFASGALIQYDADLASDGHFVAYEVQAARNDVAQFLRNLADEPQGRVPGG